MVFKLITLFISFSVLHIIAHSQTFDEVQKIRVDPSNAMGGKVSQYIDTVRFIPLESNTKSIFGKIDQLEIAEKFFIILDVETNSILIFNKQGKFHTKIEGNKVIKGFRLYNFYYQNSVNLIEIPGFYENYFYNLDGKLVRKEKFKDRNEWRFGRKMYIGNKHVSYYYNNSGKNISKDSIAYELMLADENKLIHHYFPYSKKYPSMQTSDILSSTHFYPANSDTMVYYIGPYSYTIYKLTPHTLVAAYDLIFPAQYSLPANFTTDSSFNGKRQLYILQNGKTVISRISNFYKTNNSIFLNARLSYIYNTQFQKLVCINNIVSDSGSYFLPITDAEVGGMDFRNYGLLNFDGKTFYTSYSSAALFRQMEATKNKQPQYPEVLSTYFVDKKNAKGNPVLIQIQFKQVF